MPLCGEGDIFDSRESGGLGPGGDSNVSGPDEFPHTPVNESGGKCPSSAQVLKLRQGQKARVRLQLLDVNGQTVPIPSSEESGSSSSSPITSSFKFRFIVKQYSGAGKAVIDRPGTLIDADESIVEFALFPKHLCLAGLFTAQLIAYADGDTEDTCASTCHSAKILPSAGYADDVVYWVTPYWVEVAPTHHMSSNGPPTLAEIRLMMRDQCPGQNELLGDYEYTDDEIAICIADPVDQFNITRPPLTRYTVDTFPRQFRYYWKRAVMGQLMQVAARHYLREQMAYSAGGVQVDDKNKYEAYMTFAGHLIKEWERFIIETKIRMNMNKGWGSLGSGYRQ